MKIPSGFSLCLSGYPKKLAALFRVYSFRRKITSIAKFGIIMLFVLDIHSARAQYYKVRAEKENKEYTADKKEKTQEQETHLEATRVNNKICPVDSKSLYEARQKGPKEFFLYTYEGKTYDFDSPACVEKFKKDPQGYLEEWEKKERFRRINVIND